MEKCLLQRDVQALMAENDDRMLAYLNQADMALEGSPIYDTTLRFTLSALWNLTDECPEACETFVNVGGLVIYAKVLKVRLSILNLSSTQIRHQSRLLKIGVALLKISFFFFTPWL